MRDPVMCVCVASAFVCVRGGKVTFRPFTSLYANCETFDALPSSQVVCESFRVSVFKDMRAEYSKLLVRTLDSIFFLVIFRHFDANKGL